MVQGDVPLEGRIRVEPSRVKNTFSIFSPIENQVKFAGKSRQQLWMSSPLLGTRTKRFACQGRLFPFRV